MALRPCSLCFRRFPGPSNSAYVAILDGGQKWEHKPKLCEECFLRLVYLFDDVKARIDYDATPTEMPMICLACHDDPNDKHPLPVFMTTYAARADRVDYCAAVCAGCRPQAENLVRGRQRG